MCIKAKLKMCKFPLKVSAKNGKFVKILIFIAKSSYKAKNVQKKFANCKNYKFLRSP